MPLDAAKREALMREFAPSAPPVLSADDLKVDGMQDENVIDLETFDKVYAAKQQKIESLKRRMMYESLASGEAELTLKKLKPSKIKTMPAPLGGKSKKGLTEGRAAKKPSIKISKDGAKKKEPAVKINPRAMLGRLEKVKKGVAVRAAAAAVLTLPLIYITLALKFPLPLPASVSFDSSPFGNTVMSLSLLFSVCLAGYDVIINGAYELLIFRAEGYAGLRLRARLAYILRARAD